MTLLSPFHPEVDALWQAAVQRNLRSLAIVSSLPAEGSTLIAAALARRAGLSGKPSLLVDLNLGRPGAARLFGLRPQEDEIVELPALGVSVLSRISGRNADAWREPGRLAGQIAEWGERYSFVVLDSAAVLNSDFEHLPATAAAAAADAAILAVLAGRTPVPAIRNSRERLEKAGATLIGTVMNDRDNPSLLTELERETYRLAPMMPRAMAALRGWLHKSSLLTVRA